LSIFADVLERFAAQAGSPRVSAVDARVRSPFSVAVRGRHGVGRGSVARALAASGVRVSPEHARADLQVLVLAEALKPEDRSVLDTDVPTVVVLNKADLSGRVTGGPLESSARVASGIGAAVGRPVVPMIAPLATADLDDEMVSALRVLATTPADMTSTDAFVATEHLLPAPVRHRLLARLDRFGIAHAVLAVAGGADAATVAERLRGLSQIDRVIECVGRAEPEAAYRRVCAAVDELQTLAVETRDEQLASFLSGDEVVVAVMAAAVDVVVASGVRVDAADDPGAHVRRALRWRRYADGPLDALHRRCAGDIARGSLRLLGRAERRGMSVGRAERRGMSVGRAERRGMLLGRAERR
jgi:hypothetical protein